MVKIPKVRLNLYVTQFQWRQLKKIVKSGLFTNVSEFVRKMIGEGIEKYQKRAEELISKQKEPDKDPNGPIIIS